MPIIKLSGPRKTNYIDKFGGLNSEVDVNE